MKNIVIFLTLFILLIPTICFALDQDSIYVWSNRNASLETSVIPSENEELKNESR